MAEFDLLRFMDRAEWMADANCLGVSSEVFFPGRGEDIGFARSICRACDVQAECLAYALNNGERFGIWGGMSEHERRAIRRGRAVNARGPIPPSELQRHEHGTTTGFRQHLYRGTDPCAACRSAYAVNAQFSRPSRAGVTG